MNIFYLDPNPEVAARYHCDKHVVKMILESAQLLCTAHRELDSEVPEELYKATHKNHPCSIWVRESIENYNWLYKLFCYLCDEYTFRYNKIHTTDKKLRNALIMPPSNIPKTTLTNPPKAMPDEYKCNDVVASYRAYYNGDKKRFARWTNREIPTWFNSNNCNKGNLQNG